LKVKIQLVIPLLRIYSLIVNLSNCILLVGKTAIGRILAGLWPCFEGVIKKPRAEDIMYLPQRPYLSLGSLRDQLSTYHVMEM
jgi:hypothetical protein